MQKQKIITFRVNEDEQKLISKLSQLLERNQSDAIRFVLLKAQQKLEKDPGWLIVVKSAKLRS